MHEVLVNRLGGLSLPRKSVVRLTDRPDMTIDVYRGRNATIQQQSTKEWYENHHSHPCLKSTNADFSVSKKWLLSVDQAFAKALLVV